MELTPSEKLKIALEEKSPEMLAWVLGMFCDSFSKSTLKTAEDYLIEFDKSGKWCFCAMSIPNVSQEKMVKAILKKDKTGKWCLFLLKKYGESMNSQKEELINAIISRDNEGTWLWELFCFLRDDTYYTNEEKLLLFETISERLQERLISLNAPRRGNLNLKRVENGKVMLWIEEIEKEIRMLERITQAEARRFTIKKRNRKGVAR